MDLDVRDEHAAGRMTLSHPVHNALTPAMVRAISAALPVWVRAPITYCVLLDSGLDGVFSAGTDLADLCNRARTHVDDALQGLADSYALVWQLDCFTKPEVSFIDGPAVGAGFGLAAFGTHQVAGERFVFSAPQTASGWFPDHGLSYLFARLPASIGMYLALTGASLGAADAFALRLVTHVIPAALHPGIRARLCDADPVDPLLDDLHVDPGRGSLVDMQDAVDRCFSAPTVEEIIARLERETGAGNKWGQDVAADLRVRSPMSLKITHRAVQAAARLDLRETLIQDYRIAARRLQDQDLAEASRDGARQPPRWSPPTLADVSEGEVARCFEPAPGGDLALSTRLQMQATGT